MDWLNRDFRMGLRHLARDKAFSLTVALTLAFCLGANTALFSVVHHVLLRPLPVPEPDRILLMSNQYPKAGAGDSSNSGVVDYYDRLRDATVFEEQALFNTGSLSLGQDGLPTRIRVLNVTPSYFRLMRVAPVLGRAFTEQDGEPGNEKKVLLTDALWQSQFGGDPNAVGRDLRLDGQPYTVVGVLPKAFQALAPGVSALPAPRVHPRAEVRRQPAQQQLLEHRAAEAGRHPRSGPGPDRRPERRESRAVPAIQGAPHQRRLPYRRRPVPRSPGAGGEAHLVPSLGRRPVRAPHRERERGEPRPGARPRAPQGAGDAAGPGRIALAGGAPARDREPGAEPGRRGRRPPGRGRRPAHARQLRPARTWPTPATSAWTGSPPSTRSPSPWPSAS